MGFRQKINIDNNKNILETTLTEHIIGSYGSSSLRVLFLSKVDVTRMSFKRMRAVFKIEKKKAYLTT